MLSFPEVKELTPAEVAQYAANHRDDYLEHFELEEQERESVRNFTKIDTDLLKPNGYRYIPDAESVGKLNVEVPDLSALAKLSQSEALWLLEQSRSAVAAAVYDPLFQEDYQWYFDQKFKEIERAIRGRDTDRMEDWSCRAAQSFSVRMLRSVGLREVADEVALEFFPENPKYDSRHSSKLVSGAGDFAAMAVIAVVLGSVFLFFFRRHRKGRSSK